MNDQWIDEEQNMLENYPEIRNPSLKRPPIRQVMRQKFGKQFGGFLIKLGGALKWMSLAFAGLTVLSACAPPTITPNPTPKPPVEKPDPDKPDPDNPEPDKPDPDKPNPDITDPVKPDPDNTDPDKPDPDKLTKEQVISYIKENVQSNVQEALGKRATNINYLGFDYQEIDGEPYVDVLVEYHRETGDINQDEIRLVRVPMQVAISEENIKNGTFKPTTQWDGKKVFDMPKVEATQQTTQVLEKIKADGLLEFEDGQAFSSLAYGGGGADTTLGCGATFVTVNRLDGNKFVSYYLSVKSDGVNPNGFLVDNLINGTLNETYRVVSKTEYEFSDNAIILFADEAEKEQ